MQTCIPDLSDEPRYDESIPARPLLILGALAIIAIFAIFTTVLGRRATT